MDNANLSRVKSVAIVWGELYLRCMSLTSLDIDIKIKKQNKKNLTICSAPRKFGFYNLIITLHVNHVFRFFLFCFKRKVGREDIIIPNSEQVAIGIVM